MYLRSVEWLSDKIRIIDQNLLPNKLVYKDLTSLEEVADAIKSMKVRGAPLIGVVAALGLALVAKRSRSKGKELLKILYDAYKLLASTRPTAVNLFNAMDKVLEETKKNPSPDMVELAAKRILDSEVYNNKKISEYGIKIFDGNDSVLTHCNTGSLAAVEIGTALGVVIEGVKKGLVDKVYITETRPKLQGARLTAFELLYADIKPILIVDSAAPFLIKKGLIDVVIVGADRILRDGTVYNKIGTYSLALSAYMNGVDFYVAAPTTTFDLESSRDEIEIEVRDGNEIIRFGGCEVAPSDVDTFNIAFDETPPEYVTGIITEKGILSPPYEESILSVVEV